MLCTLLLGVSAAEATPRSNDPIERAARSHAELGTGLYKMGQYEQAVAEWTAGFALIPKPLFLLNLGQAYRRLGKRDQAVEMFTRFLDVAPADDPDRAGTTVLVAELRAEIDRLNPPRATPTRRPPPLEAPPVVAPAPPVAQTPSTPAPALVITVTRPPLKRQSFIRRHWWIVPVTTLAAAGVAVGLGLGLTAGAPACAKPSCYDLTGTQ